MMNSAKKIFLILLLCCTHQLFAQKYITAGGLRFSNQGFGFTVQQRIADLTTIEGIALINTHEYSFAALFEQHHKIVFQKRLNIYTGIGPKVGFYYADSSYFGADVLLGAEYKSLLFPFVISADIKPTFKLEENDWFDMGFGISLRYVFVKENKGIFHRKK